MANVTFDPASIFLPVPHFANPYATSFKDLVKINFPKYISNLPGFKNLAGFEPGSYLEPIPKRLSKYVAALGTAIRKAEL